MSTVQAKLRYLIKTKRLIKEKIQENIFMPDDTVFRRYPDYIGLIGAKLCKHDTSFSLLPAPRVKSFHVLELPVLSHETVVFYLPTPRIKTAHTVNVDFISHDTVAQRTTHNFIVSRLDVVIPSITHETEVI